MRDIGIAILKEIFNNTGPNPQVIKGLIQKFYKRHLVDASRQLIEDIKTKNLVSLQELNVSQYLNVSKSLSKLGPNEEDPTSRGSYGILYNYSTTPTLMDKDNLKSTRLKSGAICFEPSLEVTIYVVKDKISHVEFTTLVGFENLPELEGGYFRPGYKTKF